MRYLYDNLHRQVKVRKLCACKESIPRITNAPPVNNPHVYFGVIVSWD